MTKRDDAQPSAIDATPIIPYADRDLAGRETATLLDSTEERLGFLPNSFLLYMHAPHIFRQITRLNNTVMRHQDNVLSEEFKYRLALLISRNHGCRYCTAHESHTMKKKFGLDDARIEEILLMQNPADEREAVAWEFVHAASLGPEHVDDDLRSRLTEVFTPVEVMEIACTLGFWSFYNRVHASLGIPLEAHLHDEAHWVDMPVDENKAANQ